MQVEVDRNVCIGAGNCVMTVAQVFDQDEEGTVVLRQPDPPADLIELVERATQICPSAAIRIS